MTASISPWYSHPYSTAGRRIFVIGDVHGMRAPMDALLDTFRVLSKEGSPDENDLVWLGDVVDRGPESWECLKAYLCEEPWLGRVVRLCGNHEQIMLLALGFHPNHQKGVINYNEFRALDMWLDNGGLAAAKDFIRAAGLKVPADDDDGRGIRDGAMQALKELQVDLQRRFFAEEGSYYRAGNVIFVHGGINPLFDQKRFLGQSWWQFPKRDENDHWAWVRAPFLRAVDPGGEGTLVVHGHTPEPSAIRNFCDLEIPVPEDFGDPDQIAAYLDAGGHRIRGGKLNLDGGAPSTGLVAGAQIEDDRYRIIWAWS